MYCLDHGCLAMLSLVMSASVTIVWAGYLSCQQGLALHLLHPHQSWRPPLLFWQLPCQQSWRHCQDFWRILLLPLAGSDPPKAQSCREGAEHLTCTLQAKAQRCPELHVQQSSFSYFMQVMLTVHHLLNTCLPLGTSVYSSE